MAERNRMPYRRCGWIIWMRISCAAAVWIVLVHVRSVGLDSPLTAFCATCGALGIVVVNSSTIRWFLPKFVMRQSWEKSSTV